MPKSEDRFLHWLANGAVLLITLILWFVCGFVEGNWLIPLAAALVMGATLVILMATGLWRRIMCLFAVGLLIRTIVCLLAWYQAKGTEYAYWTGLNPDSNRYYLNSYLPVPEAALTTEDPGFPVINSVITRFAERYGEDHYLVNVQLPLICGVLFALATYLWGCQLFDEKSARLAGWFIALHPIVVGWSTGLMRDTMVAAAGWLMVFATAKLLARRVRFRWLYLGLSIAAGTVAWAIRDLTLYYLLIVAVTLGASAETGIKRLSRPIKSMFLAVGLACLGMIPFYSNLRYRLDAIWQYGLRARATIGLADYSINEGGISAQLARSDSMMQYAALAPYEFIAPFPIYAIPQGFNGEPGRLVDYIASVGGFLNLMTLGWFVCAMLFLARERQWLQFLGIGGGFYLICLISIITTAQSRWLMGSIYPSYFLAVAWFLVTCEGKNWRNLIDAVVFTAAVYMTYWSLKIGWGIAGLVIIGGASAGVIGLVMMAMYRRMVHSWVNGRRI